MRWCWWWFNCGCGGGGGGGGGDLENGGWCCLGEEVGAFVVVVVGDSFCRPHL